MVSPEVMGLHLLGTERARLRLGGIFSYWEMAESISYSGKTFLEIYYFSFVKLTLVGFLSLLSFCSSSKNKFGYFWECPLLLGAVSGVGMWCAPRDANAPHWSLFSPTPPNVEGVSS